MPACVRYRPLRLTCRPRHSVGISQSENRYCLFALSITRRSSLTDDATRRDYDGDFYRGTPNPVAKNIAVLGGGITGLATTFHLLKQLPASHVTLYESSKRLGGWIESEKVEVDGGHVIFENGPRTLRNDKWTAAFTRDLVALLGLEDQVLHISRNSAASRNRYIYYPDHLVRLPGLLPGGSTLMNLSRNALTLWQEPLFNNLFSGLLHHILNAHDFLRPNTLQDESIGNFVTRIFNHELADNLVSAVAHGIYAGDIYRLSARSLFPMLWDLETHNDGAGIARNLFFLYANNSVLVPYSDVVLHNTRRFDLPPEEVVRSEAAYTDTSIFTFKHGLDTFTKRLASAVRESPRVTVKTDHTVKSISRDTSDGSLMVGLSHGPFQTKHKSQNSSQKVDYVVSSISPRALEQSLAHDSKDSATIPHSDNDAYQFSNETYAVNVMVVNLYYSQPNLISVQGFGYLIPRSIPWEQNPERALGVIFGSDSSVGQDTAPGTKLTVMLGGHWWDGFKSNEFPDEQSAIEMAQNVLHRHLGVSAKPLVAKAVFQKNAIPQYTVGHHDKMSKLHELLLSKYKGRLKVVGNWFQGIGVNACTNAARKSVLDIREGFDQKTGLEEFGRPKKWGVWDPRESTTNVPVVMD